jgi:predicted hotdog family 3-hydroxylacyl-ACP dehydratase
VTLLLDRAAIAALIPHEGSMCLLDGVVAWDQGSILCVASSHRAANNPLAAEGRLDAVCGVEYAAQAMAAHGGLLAGGRRPAAGYLASLRDVVCAIDRLDLLEGDLLVSAELLIADGARVIYRFELSSDGAPVMSGRAAVVIDAGPV